MEGQVGNIKEKNVMDLIKSGEIIQAIKLHREETGIGLLDAKNYVYQLREKNEMKALKSNNIDEMKENIYGMASIDDNQKNFILDLIEESFYLGEDNGHQNGYNQALEENDYDEDGEEQIFQDGYDNGFESGREDGKQEGYEEGHETGYDEGHENGYEDGKSDGYNSGYEDGKEEGYEDGKEEGSIPESPNRT